MESSITLINPETGISYTLNLSKADVDRCRTDTVFAQGLLEYAEKESLPNQNVTNIDSSDDHGEAGPSSSESHNWSHNETLALITCYETHSEDFHNVKKRKKVWIVISNELLSLNIVKPPAKCEMKWRNLLRTYKAIKDNNKKTGRGSSRFQFYDKIDDIVGTRPSVSCDHTFSSTTSDAENSSENATKEVINVESDNTAPIQAKKVKRNYSTELVKLKIDDLKKKQEAREEKEKQRQDKLEVQRKLLEIEERKLILFEKYINSNSNPRL